MNLTFPEINGLPYKRLSQRIRVLSEAWLKNEMYCPACGNEDLTKLPNNSKLADFRCNECGEIYELKSKGGAIGKTILDGAYYAAIERITSSTNPNLFVLRYEGNNIRDLTLVPKYFFTADTLKIRRALSQQARRAGYIGAVIMYGNIPRQGKIDVVVSQSEILKDTVMKNYRRAVSLKVNDINMRGWLMDIMLCIEKIAGEIFSLNDIYAFIGELTVKHPDNRNITAKIRQQLQLLRNKGFMEFLGGGKYRKAF